MKANTGAAYYEKYYEDFLKKSKVNLEKQLAYAVDFLAAVELPEEEVEKIKKAYARDIAVKVEKQLRERMITLKNLEAGKASLGYSSTLQAATANANFRKMFEFDCYQLSVFKKRYAI